MTSTVKEQMRAVLSPGFRPMLPPTVGRSSHHNGHSQDDPLHAQKLASPRYYLTHVLRPLSHR